MSAPAHNTLPKRRCWITLTQQQNALPADITVEDKFTVDHLIKVLRLKAGEEILAIGETHGVGYIATIKAIEKNHVLLILKSIVTSPANVSKNVILAAGLIKETHWEWLLQKATELGVSEVIPLKSKFSDIQDRMVKPDRWRQIVKAAALQSERFSIPNIHGLIDINTLHQSLPDSSQKILLQERAQDIPNLLSYLPSTNPKEPMVIVIGPEGGWHADETSMLKQQGFQPVTLGPQILRADTAAIAALSCALCSE